MENEIDAWPRCDLTWNNNAQCSQMSQKKNLLYSLIINRWALDKFNSQMHRNIVLKQTSTFVIKSKQIPFMYTICLSKIKTLKICIK